MAFKVHPKEKIYFVILSIINIFIYGIVLKHFADSSGKSIFFTLGEGIFYFVFFVPIIRKILSLLFTGHIKGNAIKINERQFPDIFSILKEHSAKLGLNNIPDMYLLQGNGILNAFATRVSGRDFIILHSDVLEAAYQEGKDAVSFIIGHELGHIKRKHTHFSKTMLLWPAKLIPFLGNAYSRACEYTCDNIGYNLCPEGATKGILILASGKQLYKKVNADEFIFNTAYELDIDVSFAEIFSTHPALVKRLAVIHQLNQDRLSQEKQIFVSPKFTFKDVEMQQ